MAESEWVHRRMAPVLARYAGVFLAEVIGLVIVVSFVLHDSLYAAGPALAVVVGLVTIVLLFGITSGVALAIRPGPAGVKLRVFDDSLRLKRKSREIFVPWSSFGTPRGSGAWGIVSVPLGEVQIDGRRRRGVMLDLPEVRAVLAHPACTVRVTSKTLLRNIGMKDNTDQ